MTGQVYVDEVDVDEEGIAEMVMDDNTIAQVSRPGTSLKQPGTGRGAPSQGVRCERIEMLYVTVYYVSFEEMIYLGRGVKKNQPLITV